MRVDATRWATVILGTWALAGPALISNARAGDGMAHFHAQRPGRDDCAPGTRHRKAEWGPEFCRAKSLSRLDCQGLAGYSEGLRHAYNRQAFATYHRPWGGMAAPEPSPAATPATDIRVPAAAPAPDASVPATEAGDAPTAAP